MKKKTEWCDFCQEYTKQRHKRRCYWKGKREGYGTIVLPVMCYSCGAGRITTPREKKKRPTHTKI